MEKNIRVLVVDDNDFVRKALRAILEHEKDIEIVGDCGSGTEALVKAGMLAPDIVLMDIQMPRLDGISTCRTLKNRGLNGEVIMLTLHEEYLDEAMDAGAAAFVSKTLKGVDLLDIIRQVYWHGGSKSKKDRRTPVERKPGSKLTPPTD